MINWNGLFNKGAKFAVKLNTKRTMLVGLAFLSICIFWQMYDSVMTLILTDTFHLNETIAGAVMAADNVLALFLLPFFIQQNFGIELPSTLEIIILLFIFASEILGELKCYFITYPHWDSMLHTTTGFLCAATGFALIDILNRNSKIKFQLSPIYVALAAFCFSMTVGVLWEFFEFGMDRLFMMDMQKDTVVNAITSVMLDPTNSNIPVTIDGITSVTINGQELGLGGYLDIGLYDTMGDLFVNFIGAAVFSTIGYFYIKQRGKGKLAKAFIPTITEEERAAELPEGTEALPEGTEESE